MANSNGDFRGAFLWLYFLRKYCFLRRADTKKTKIGAAVAVVVVPGCRRGAAGAGGAVVVVLVRFNSKSYIVMLLRVYFNG